ncbi:arylesterase [Mucilaginibacter sp. SG564]|uniref:arylesterase n=1 Tax=unclassified Mucilaginibacter TaxID=2617802 RepID=UPI0015579D21|nr:arylesterase [Mucilaginibacter sp. SG564]NOW95541.1 acyl-CoA thioesterase-1 [Mucilaginibacter sp. SG564]
MYKFKLTFLLLTALIFAACDQNKKPTADESTKSSTAAQPDAAAASKTVLFFGDSLTAGYGLDDPSEAFPGVIKDKIDSLKLPYKVVNAGLSGETTAGGNARLDWLLKQKVDVFILELGANDGLRGIPVNETHKNLQSIIDKVKAKYPEVKIVLLGMQVPPNMGADYASKFKAVFPDLATKNHTQLVPFFLQGVAGIPTLNQADGIHPTPQGAKIAANNVWEVLKGIL